jgi:amino acid transporter
MAVQSDGHGARTPPNAPSACEPLPGHSGRRQPSLVEQRPGSDPQVGALIGGMIAAFFSLGGWWDVSKVAGEVRDRGRNLPRALLLGVTIVTFVYILISLVFLYLVPPERIDSREPFAALTGEALFGRAGGVVLSLIVVVTVLGSLAALLMAMPRVYFAMARDGLFFPTTSTASPIRWESAGTEGSKTGTLLTGLPSRAGSTPPRSVA